MSDIRAELKEMLHEFPTVQAEETEDMVVATGNDENGFRVMLFDEPEEITVCFEGWHQHFPKDQHREALGLFLTGLADTCRLHVFTRGNTDYTWVVELKNFQGCWLYGGMLMRPFPALAFWKNRSQRRLQNTAVTREDIERLFPEARQPEPEEEPASA
jgi:hypothetical protein